MQKHTFQSEVCAADSPGDVWVLTATDLRADRIQQPRVFAGPGKCLLLLKRFLKQVTGPLALSAVAWNRDPVGTGSAETDRVSKTGITERNRCQLYLVYNSPDGKQASFYFYLIQHR